MSLSGKDIVLGITSSIAAYKAAAVTSRLTKAGAQVYVVMTKNATEFITPLTLESLSHHPVVTDTFSREHPWEIEHIALAKRAQAFLVAPATANILAKMAHGIADDMLSTTLLATRAPVFVAPAMNTAMLHHPATKENLETLGRRGVQMIAPGQGLLACGDVGDGRMAEPEEIVAALEAYFARTQDFAGKRVLVTAGPTQEDLDPVRYLTNRSSGKMGYALAEAARDRGADVTLLSGPVPLAPPAGVRVESFRSTRQLLSLMEALAPGHDVVIQAAAPADFAAREVQAQKIKKAQMQELTLTLVPNPDVASIIGAGKRAGQVLVGFAAETENLMENARGKLERKHFDLIVANDITRPGAGFQGDTNEAILIWREGSEALAQMPKRQMAEKILDRIGGLSAPALGQENKGM